MKTAKRFASALLSAALLFGLAACSGGGSSSGQGGEGNATLTVLEYGRYVEENITPEGMKGNVSSLRATEEGVIDIVTVDYGSEATGWQSSYEYYRSTDNGATWQQMDMSWTEKYISDTSWALEEDYELPDSMSSLGTMSVLDNGDVLTYCSTYYYTEERMGESETVFLRAAPDGSVQEITIAAIDELVSESDGFSISNMEYLGNDRLFIQMYVFFIPDEDDMASMMAYSSSETIAGIYDLSTGELTVDLSFWEGWRFFTSDNVLYLLQNYNEYIAIDAATGQQLDIPVPSQEEIYALSASSMMTDGNLAADSENNFYVVNGNGLYKLGQSGEEAERLMEGVNYSYGSPVAYLTNFRLGMPGEYIVSLEYADEPGRVMRYYYDEEAPAKTNQHIEVYAMYDSTTVRLAISEFRRQYPEITIGYEYTFERFGSYNEETAQSPEDVLKTLNSELLSGNGPDVLILDDLPFESYGEKGILVNLADVVEGLGLEQAILAPMYEGDAIYAMPTRFGLPLMFGNDGYVQQFTTVDAIVAEVLARPGSEQPDYDNFTEEDWAAWNERWYMTLPEEERPVFAFESLDEVIEMLFQTSAPAIYTTSGGINREVLSQLLEASKAIGEHYKLETSEWYQYGVSGGYTMTSGGAAYGYSQTASAMGRGQATLGYQLVTTFEQISSVGNYPYWYRSNSEEELPTLALGLAPGFTGGVYSPTVIVGVCSTSSNVEGAKNFVGTLLSDGVQNYDLGEGFPVSPSALQAQYAKYNERSQWEVQEGMERIQMDWNSLFASLSEPMFKNEYLYNIIHAAAVEYCEGANLDSVLDKVISDTELYFAERQ